MFFSLKNLVNTVYTLCGLEFAEHSNTISKSHHFGSLITLFLTNQIPGNIIDFKMNVIRHLKEFLQLAPVLPCIPCKVPLKIYVQKHCFTLLNTSWLQSLIICRWDALMIKLKKIVVHFQFKHAKIVLKYNGSF